jgi:hypothetical protein
MNPLVRYSPEALVADCESLLRAVCYDRRWTRLRLLAAEAMRDAR